MTAEHALHRPSAPGSYAKGRARRQEIVRAATRHFGDRGFTGATILDIANACGITRAGLLHYFADKEALLEAVLEDRDAADRERFRPYARMRGGIGVLRGMVDLAEHNRVAPGLIELFVSLSAEARHPSHPAHEYLIERYERIRNGTAGAVQSAIDHGYVRQDVNATDAAMRLTALMDGLQSQWLLDNTIDMAHHIRAQILDLLTPAGVDAFNRATVQLRPTSKELDS